MSCSQLRVTPVGTQVAGRLDDGAVVCIFLGSLARACTAMSERLQRSWTAKTA